MSRQSYDVTRRLQLLREILDDLLTFWASANGREVDAALLRQFEWAIDEAYEDLAQLLVTDLPAEEAGDESQEDG